MKKALGICALMALTALPVNGGEGITVRVTPATSFAPGHLLVRARIEPNAANRSLAIIADGESFYRSSEIPLDGDGAPKIVEMRYPGLPGGEYEIYAVLMDSSGRERAVAHQQATVLSIDGF
jgi:hypothetical protein